MINAQRARNAGNLSVFLGRTLSGFQTRIDQNESRALIIPPAVPGSLGDAAMISSASYFLRQAGANSVDLLYGKDWPLDEKIDRRIGGERFFYRQSMLQQALLVSRLPQYSECYLIGADVIDGAYNPASVTARISLLAEAAHLGKKATLLGASYNTHPNQTTHNALRHLPVSVVVCARDPVSKKRMEDSLNRPIRQVADLAFLLRPRNDHSLVRQAKDWIESRRSAGNQIIGLNANYLHAEKNPAIAHSLCILVEQLLRHDVSLVLIPHDTRSKQPDQTLLENATALLSTKDRERVFMLPPISPGVVRAVVPHLDMLVTGRMHAAILALSGGTSAFCFAYQDKFEGLFQLFDIENADLLSTPAELSRHPAKVGEKIIGKLNDRESIERNIKEHLPEVIQLAKNNFL